MHTIASCASCICSPAFARRKADEHGQNSLLSGSRVRENGGVDRLSAIGNRGPNAIGDNERRILECEFRECQVFLSPDKKKSQCRLALSYYVPESANIAYSRPKNGKTCNFCGYFIDQVDSCAFSKSLEELQQKHAMRNVLRLAHIEDYKIIWDAKMGDTILQWLSEEVDTTNGGGWCGSERRAPSCTQQGIEEILDTTGNVEGSKWLLQKASEHMQRGTPLHLLVIPRVHVWNVMEAPPGRNIEDWRKAMVFLVEQMRLAAEVFLERAWGLRPGKNPSMGGCDVRLVFHRPPLNSQDHIHLHIRINTKVKPRCVCCADRGFEPVFDAVGPEAVIDYLARGEEAKLAAMSLPDVIAWMKDYFEKNEGYNAKKFLEEQAFAKRAKDEKDDELAAQRHLDVAAMAKAAREDVVWPAELHQMQKI